MIEERRLLLRLVNGDRKSTGTSFGSAGRSEFFTHSFSQSSSDGTVTSACWAHVLRAAAIPCPESCRRPCYERDFPIEPEHWLTLDSVNLEVIGDLRSQTDQQRIARSERAR